VSAVLGVPVKRFEDGTAPRQVDALVQYPDRLAALEVWADHDPDLNAQWEALERMNYQLQVPGLRQSWGVILKRKAKIKRLASELPSLLLALQNDPAPRPSWRVPPGLERLKVSRVWPIAGAQSGLAYLHMQPSGGFAGDERTVGEWVTTVLSGRAADVPTKLADHPGVAERHAFIWIRPNSDFGVQAQLESGDDHPFPTTPPLLPEGVTHVWVAGSTWFQGVLAWFPDRSWWRTPWTWQTIAQ
jgi:hypothetical protein